VAEEKVNPIRHSPGWCQKAQSVAQKVHTNQSSLAIKTATS